MKTSSDPLIIYVFGVGHAGSTLLNYLLNAHPHILGLGEIHYLRDEMHKDHSSPGYLLNRPEWQEIEKIYQSRTGLSLSSFESRHDYLENTGDALEKWRQDHRVLLDILQEKTGVSIIVDSSKRAPRALQLLTAGFRVKVIYLQRNGYALMNSYHKYGNSFFRAYFYYLEAVMWAFRLSRQLPKDDWCTVSYEALATDTEATLTKLCKFIGVDYTPEMLNYNDKEYLGIRGNRGTRSTNEIRFDEKWLKQLPTSWKYLFTITGAWLDLKNNRLSPYKGK